MPVNRILPPEALTHTSRIIWTGEKHLLIEQHRGIFSYDKNCIRVRIGEKLLTVRGNGLVIRRFGADDLVIQGNMLALEFDS